MVRYMIPFGIVLVVVLGWVVVEILRSAFLGFRAVQNGKRVEPVSQLVEHPIATVLVIGDSTSLGTGAARRECSLVGRLAANFPSLSITNASQNALHLANLNVLLEGYKDQSFDFVMIHIGGIDTISFTPMKTIRTRIDVALRHAKRIAREKVFLVSPNNSGLAPLFHFPFRQFFTWRSRRVSALFHAQATQHGVVHIPLFREAAEDPLMESPKTLFASDGTHPNDDGYARWYCMIQEGVSPYFTLTHHD